MGTYTQLLYQIVYSTKYRTNSLSKDHRTELHNYIWGILSNKKCHPYQIGGVDDHLHLVTHIHPTIALSDLVKDIKLASSDLIKEMNWFPSFEGWQGGYAAFTYSIDSKDNLVKYVLNQEKHHQVVTYVEELKELCREHQVEFDERFLL